MHTNTMRKGDEMKKILKSTQSIICSFMVMCLMCSRAPMQVRAEETSVSASDVQAEEISVSVSDVQAEETSVSASDAQVYQVTENVYYVDAVNGNDENDGHSIGTAWKTLEKVNSHTFEAGESILLRSGGVWEGQLWPKGSGTEGNPIKIGSYGEGERPVINGAGVLNAVYLENQEYWEIADLEVTNISNSEDAREGIKVTADITDRFLSHIVIKNCYVHDVTGTMSRKDTGGIFVTGNYNGVLIENNTVRDVYRTGILSRAKRNVVIRNNMVDSIGGDGIQVGGGSMSPLIEYNVAKDCYNRYTAGEYNVAIWPYDTNDAVLQYNEAYLTHNTLDGQGFDCDYMCNGTIFQYNYSHDNEGGFMLICSVSNQPDYESFNRNSIIRYNISQNDRNRIFQIHSSGTQGTQIYNNTIYIGEGLSPKIYDFDTFRHPGTVYSYNNIFYNVGNGTYSYGLQNYHVFEHNLFYGNHPSSEPNDPYKVTADPKLAAPGTGGIGWDTTTGYQLTAGSAAINAGKYIQNNGGKDYWGNALYNGAPDIGAHEYYGELYPEEEIIYQGYKIAHTDSQISYTGKWESSRDDHWSNQAGAGFTVNFYGNQIKINGPADPSHGIMAVSVDGGEEVMVDTYSAARDSKTLYTSPMLELGEHTLKVRVTGQKNPAAKNSYVDFHNVEIVPDYTKVQSYEAGAKKGMIDYYGNWYYGNNDSWSTRAGDFYQMTFEGTAVRVIGVKDAGFADIAVSIDGGEETIIQTTASRRQGDVVLYEAQGLSKGEHVIKVRLLTSGSHTLARLEYLPLLGKTL